MTQDQVLPEIGLSIRSQRLQRRLRRGFPRSVHGGERQLHLCGVGVGHDAQLVLQQGSSWIIQGIEIHGISWNTKTWCWNPGFPGLVGVFHGFQGICCEMYHALAIKKSQAIISVLQSVVWPNSMIIKWRSQSQFGSTRNILPATSHIFFTSSVRLVRPLFDQQVWPLSSADKLWITVRQLCTTMSKILSSASASWSFNTAGSCMEPETSMTKQRFAGKPGRILKGGPGVPEKVTDISWYFVYYTIVHSPDGWKSRENSPNSATLRNVVLHRLQRTHGFSPHPPGLDRLARWVPTSTPPAMWGLRNFSALAQLVKKMLDLLEVISWVHGPFHGKNVHWPNYSYQKISSVFSPHSMGFLSRLIRTRLFICVSGD